MRNSFASKTCTICFVGRVTCTRRCQRGFFHFSCVFRAERKDWKLGQLARVQIGRTGRTVLPIFVSQLLDKRCSWRTLAWHCRVSLVTGAIEATRLIRIVSDSVRNDANLRVTQLTSSIVDCVSICRYACFLFGAAEGYYSVSGTAHRSFSHLSGSGKYHFGVSSDGAALGIVFLFLFFIDAIFSCHVLCVFIVLDNWGGHGFETCRTVSRHCA